MLFSLFPLGEKAKHEIEIAIPTKGKMKKSIGAKVVLYPTPVIVVGSYDKNNNPNVMTVAWSGICCSSPPCVTISLQKTRYSYKNILENKAYTLNITPEKYVKEADYFGIVSGKNVDKFETTGLTSIKSKIVNAPYIKEFPLILECKLIHTYIIGLHTQFIGEIIDVKIDETSLDNTGAPNIEKIKPAVFAPLDKNYYGVGKKIGKAFSIGKTFLS